MKLTINKELCLPVLISLFPTIMLSETFCIQNQDELLKSLDISSQNKENDTLRIVKDTQIKDIKLPSEIGYKIKIEGGYSLYCTNRLSEPFIQSATKQLSSTNEVSLKPQQNTTGPIPPKEVKLQEETLQVNAVAGEGAEVTVLGVPAYAWRHGCGPTALGMVVGYWDAMGYNNLFDGDATSQTSSVNQGIASENGISGHYEDYSVPEDSYPNLETDKSELPAEDRHISDSIADFMFTSWSSENNYYGWSWSNHITIAFNNYVQVQDSNYLTSTKTYYYNYDSTLNWDVLTHEIDAQRPMIFLVDSSGDGYTDHFITIVGYRIDGDTKYYGSLDTWYPYDTVRWEEFRGISSDYAWGIWGGYSFEIKNELKPLVAPVISYLLF